MYIGVGSNLSPGKYIEEALLLLQKRERVIATSKFYWNAAIGKTGETSIAPPFLNGVWHIATAREALALKLEVLMVIEQQLGRVRKKDKYANRSIDLDILLYGDRVIASADIRVPDKDILTRPFVAIPLYEVCGDVCLPGLDIFLKNVVKDMTQTTMTPDENVSQRLTERIFR